MTRAEAAKHHIEDPAAIEHSDAHPNAVLIFIGGLGASLIIVWIIIYGMFVFLAHRRETAEQFPLVKQNQIPPEPRLETAPGVQFRELRAREDAILNTYGWVNRDTGVVRIPIDRAMDLIAQRGLPTRPAEGPVPTAPSTGPESGGPQTGAPHERGGPPQQ